MNHHQLALAIQLNAQATLTDFCWGSNFLLEQQIKNCIAGMATEHFYYIWGDIGCGKSHLLQACCQATTGTSIYLPLAILKEWGPESLDNLSEQTLIAIDDIDSIARNETWEEALFHLYNRIRDEGKTTLLVSSRKSLPNLPIHLADLKSRLAWGLVTHLNELDDDAKITSLQQQASKRGFQLPTSVGQFLINRCARNMHDLQQILDSLDKASLAAQRKITIPFVKTILGI